MLYCATLWHLSFIGVKINTAPFILLVNDVVLIRWTSYSHQSSGSWFS